MNNIKIKISILFASFLLLGSCTLIDNVDQTASFLQIDEVRVEAANSSQGEVTSKITDVWVNVDGDLIGVYPLPATIPILPKADPSSIIISAGIRNNGTTNNPVIYPFLRTATYTESLVAGETITKVPTFVYFDELEIPILEGFENGTIFTSDLDEDLATNLSISGECVKTGGAAGLLKMTLDNPAIGVSSDISFDPALIDANIAYLEMDYKNDIDFFVGIIREENGNVFPEFKINLKPREDWNKIYLDFSDELAPSSLLSYRLIFVAEIIDNAQDSAQIFLDNIRLIHR